MIRKKTDIAANTPIDQSLLSPIMANMTVATTHRGNNELVLTPIFTFMEIL